MLTAPTKFAAHNKRLGMLNRVIVKLTDGTTTWYLCNGDSDMELTDGHVYPLLEGYVSVSEGIDIFTKQWFVGEVTLTIKNQPYRRLATGVSYRFSDDISNLPNHACEIYLMAGSTATALSDCLQIFEGTVSQHPTYDADIVTVRAVDNLSLKDKNLPDTLLSSVYADCPDEESETLIPITYGDFTFDIKAPYAGLGMAHGIRTAYGLHPKFVFSDHILNAITDLWLQPVDLYPLEYTGHTLDDDDSGRGTGVGTGTYAWLQIFPTGSDYSEYDAAGVDTRATPDNEANAHDFDNTTYAESQDYADDGTGIFGFAGFVFAEEEEQALMDIAASQSSSPVRVLYNIGLGTGFVPDTGINDEHELRLYYDNTVLEASCYQLLGSYTADHTDRETIEPSVYTSTLNDKDSRFLLAVHGQDNTCALANSTTEDSTTFKVYEMSLSFGWYFPDGIGARRTVGAKGRIPNEEKGWAVLRGREIGSFITGRSSNYTAGDMCTDPATIIESILRDELGLVDADIDMPSFISAENTSVTARIQMLNRELASRILRQLAEQSTFALIFNAMSKARLVPLNDSTPTTNQIIPASHILPNATNGAPAITISKTAAYCNELKLSSRWQGEYNVYRDTSETDNSTSQTAWGIRTGEYRWPNIAGTSATHVANHLVGNATGIWANPHVEISFRTAGFTHADLEVGDWIELESATLDGQFKCFGDSWSGLQFLVVEIEKTQQDTYIKGIKLW